MIDRKQWTSAQVEALLSAAIKFTDRNELIRWVEIAPVTGHSGKSCASKYHQIVSRVEGPLTRELIDAELARSDRVMPSGKPKTRGAYPLWTGEEDARLLAACESRSVLGTEAWQKISADFPGRSMYAVRQRYLVLRNLAAGIVRQRVRSERPKRLRVRMPVKPEAIPPRLPPVEYKTLTAAFLGDPPPGRSALDKKHLPTEPLR